MTLVSIFRMHRKLRFISTNFRTISRSMLVQILERYPDRWSKDKMSYTFYIKDQNIEKFSWCLFFDVSSILKLVCNIFHRKLWCQTRILMYYKSGPISVCDGCQYDITHRFDDVCRFQWISKNDWSPGVQFVILSNAALKIVGNCKKSKLHSMFSDLTRRTLWETFNSRPFLL